MTSRWLDLSSQWRLSSYTALTPMKTVARLLMKLTGTKTISTKVRKDQLKKLHSRALGRSTTKEICISSMLLMSSLCVNIHLTLRNPMQRISIQLLNLSRLSHKGTIKRTITPMMTTMTILVPMRVDLSIRPKSPKRKSNRRFILRN